MMAVRATTAVAVLAASAAATAAPARPNVLFIVSDDLRPELGVYGGQAKTPNVDKLAASPGAVVFERSYVQQAICCPTRSSFLTGRRPDTTKVWDLHTHFRASGGDFVTLPQYFLQNGWYTMGMGKVRAQPNRLFLAARRGTAARSGPELTASWRPIACTWLRR
jgi:iduronate 2-sulfatase